MTTFSTFAADVLDRREEEGIRGIVSERNRFTLHIVGAPFAEMPLVEIRARHLRDWLRDMQRKEASDTRGARKLSTDTVKRAFALVSAVFTAAIESDLVEANPCSGVRVRRRADESATKDKWAFLSIDEQRAIASCPAIKVEDRLAIRFAVGTGLRQGEQFNLLLPDLHVDASPHVVVRFGSKGKPPKSGKVRRVPLFGDALLASREWLGVLPSFAPYNPEGLVFPSETGGRRAVGKPLGRGDAFKRVLRAAGIGRHLRWHDLRHTAATNLVTGVLGRRWTLEEVKPFMGHSSVTISERYAHVGDDALKVAARETAFAFGGIAANDFTAEIANDITLPADNDTSPDLSVWWEGAAS